jgi:hypothetical protein
MRICFIVVLIFFFTASFKLNIYAQTSIKATAIVFVLADKDFPDFISNKNQYDLCEKIQNWVKLNEANYFRLLQSKDSIMVINIEHLNTLSKKNQTDFSFYLEDLKPSFQCQRFHLIFSKQGLKNVHQDKTINQYYYLVSKNDFNFISSIIEK